MRWHVRYGDRLEWFREIAQETGEVPNALTMLPELSPGLDYLVEAFGKLTSSRQIGFNIAPIPMTEIEAYVKMFDVPDDLETFIHLLREMDNEYLKTIKEKESRGDSTKTGN